MAKKKSNAKKDSLPDAPGSKCPSRDTNELTYHVELRLILEPHFGDMIVSVEATYGVKHKTKSLSIIVSAHEELDLGK